MTSLSNIFYKNTLITKFNELKAFTNIVGGTEYGSQRIPNFSGCTNLSEVNLQNIKYLNVSFNNVFITGTAIKVVYLPNYETGIVNYLTGASVYNNYTKTEYVIFGGKCAQIGMYAFSGATSTLKAVVFKAVVPPAISDKKPAAGNWKKIYIIMCQMNL